METKVSNKAADILRTFLIQKERKFAPEFAVLPASGDKALRKTTHELVKEYFRGVLVGDTIDGPDGPSTKSKRNKIAF